MRSSIHRRYYESVQKFTTPREAKEFLVSRIISEADRESIPLSEVEKQMLYFTETYWMPYDFMEVNETFERECDTAEYEAKIVSLIRNYQARIRKTDSAEF